MYEQHWDHLNFFRDSSIIRAPCSLRRYFAREPLGSAVRPRRAVADVELAAPVDGGGHHLDLSGRLEEIERLDGVTGLEAATFIPLSQAAGEERLELGERVGDEFAHVVLGAYTHPGGEDGEGLRACGGTSGITASGCMGKDAVCFTDAITYLLDVEDLLDVVRRIRDADDWAPDDELSRRAHLSSEGGAVARQHAIVNSEQGVDACDDYGVPVGKRDLRVPSQSCRGVHGRGRAGMCQGDTACG